MSNIAWIGKTIYERAIMLDSGPLISLYNPKNNRGDKIHSVILNIQRLKYPVFITRLIIAETHKRILYDVSYSRALEFLKAITDGSVYILPVNKNDLISAIDIIERYSDQNISFTDAISMSIMKRLGIQKVLSYDAHFWMLNFDIPVEIFCLRES